MKTFVKHYVGKGKSVAGLQIAKCTCKMSDLEQFAYEYDGVLYVTFEVAKMKSPDNFGRDFTLYVTKKEETEEEPTSKKAAKKPTKKQKQELEPADKEGDDLPF
jgi:hypothetical protein